MEPNILRSEKFLFAAYSRNDPKTYSLMKKYTKYEINENNRIYNVFLLKSFCLYSAIIINTPGREIDISLDNKAPHKHNPLIKKAIIEGDDIYREK